mmetsp:Transcript_109727/g.354266  ORF Transcript_109727/g.354266 Transcript_109727/m.354266 type:complete len:231 (-) Transcript_109727:29-721(-)
MNAEGFLTVAALASNWPRMSRARCGSNPVRVLAARTSMPQPFAQWPARLSAMSLALTAPAVAALVTRFWPLVPWPLPAALSLPVICPLAPEPVLAAVDTLPAAARGAVAWTDDTGTMPIIRANAADSMAANSSSSSSSSTTISATACPMVSAAASSTPAATSPSHSAAASSAVASAPLMPPKMAAAAAAACSSNVVVLSPAASSPSPAASSVPCHSSGKSMRNGLLKTPT